LKLQTTRHEQLYIIFKFIIIYVKTSIDKVTYLTARAEQQQKTNKTIKPELKYTQ